MLSVVMPIYNEGHHIRENIARTLDVLRGIGPFELIPVDDGSSDDSRAQLERAAAEWPDVRPVKLDHAGKGEALRQGTRAARGDWVIFLDADLELPPEQITLFLALQRAHDADAVIGSKLHPDSTVSYPLIRRIYSLGYFVLIKSLFGLPIRDTQTGLKLVRRDLLLRALDLTELKGFAFDLELLVRLVSLGAKMAEAPVVVRHRMNFSSVTSADVVRIARDTWRVWRSLHRTSAPPTSRPT
ncbi:MAG TPA: glycosyltransferase family 2 protein [Verrucomicrobiae bacterium]|nr:glycosyltransferase family 2 protein [Verrucomicrobiae bacterium]